MTTNEKLICVIPLPMPVDRFIEITRKLSEAFPGCVIRNVITGYEVLESDKKVWKAEKKEDA